jgi:hypothetical protein
MQSEHKLRGQPMFSTKWLFTTHCNQSISLQHACIKQWCNAQEWDFKKLPNNWDWRKGLCTNSSQYSIIAYTVDIFILKKT